MLSKKYIEESNMIKRLHVETVYWLSIPDQCYGHYMIDISDDLELSELPIYDDVSGNDEIESYCDPEYDVDMQSYISEVLEHGSRDSYVNNNLSSIMREEDFERINGIRYRY